MADFARGDLLKRLRKERHLTQRQAADEIGTTEKSLRAWEKGGPIRWDNAKLLGKFYGRDPEELVTREVDPYAEQLERIDQRVQAIALAVNELLSQPGVDLGPGHGVLRRALLGESPTPKAPPAQDTQEPGHG